MTISFTVFALAEHGFQTYYTVEDYAISQSLHQQHSFIVHEVAHQVILWMAIL